MSSGVPLGSSVGEAAALSSSKEFQALTKQALKPNPCSPCRADTSHRTTEGKTLDTK